MPPARPLITLLTDFGTRDYFVASMKGVILSIHPEARIVDLSHDIAPHQIEEAAYVLNRCYQSFPAGTVHVAVVDPGVGSARRPLLVSTDRYYFLAPDNGLLTPVLSAESQPEIREITNEQYKIKSSGSTFDGRDLFAPASAWLAAGRPLSSFGPLVQDPVKLPQEEPVWEGRQFIGRIVYVDRFGNLISSLTRYELNKIREVTGRPNILIRIGGHTINGLVNSYSEGDSRIPQALINSDGQIEIFLKEGNVACAMNVGRGQRVDLQ